MSEIANEKSVVIKPRHQLLLNLSLTLMVVFLCVQSRILLYCAPAVSVFILVYLFRKYWDKLKNTKDLFRKLRSFLRFMQPYFPKNTYILFDNLYEKNAECIDTYCIFEYMQRHNIKSYYVIWKKNPFYKKLKAEGKLRHVIALNKSVQDSENFEFFRKCYLHLFRTRAVITSFGDLNEKITRFFFKNKYITYQHIGHGSVFLKTFVVATPYFSPLRYNKFLVANEQESEIFQHYGWDRKNLPMIGLPRWDNLRTRPHEQKTIFIMFTWRNSFTWWNEHVFRTPLNETQYVKGIKAFLGDPALIKMLKEHNVKIQYTLHHALTSLTNGNFDFSGENVEYVPSENISQYIGAADMFITDYSSLFFDFAFLDTPIVFFRPDFNDDSLLDLDKDDMANARTKDGLLYNICYDVDSAVACVGKYINNGFVLEDENKRKNAALFSTKENITENFVKYLEEL